MRKTINPITRIMGIAITERPKMKSNDDEVALTAIVNSFLAPELSITLTELFIMKAPATKEYCLGESNVTTKVADSVPELDMGLITHVERPA
jgi:hypothetical protein